MCWVWMRHGRDPSQWPHLLFFHKYSPKWAYQTGGEQGDCSSENLRTQNTDGLWCGGRYELGKASSLRCAAVSQDPRHFLSAFRLELLSIRWGPPSTEVLKFIHSFFSFQYRLEASGISIKLGDQGLFLPVLMLVGKQLVICITEKTYKDSMSGMFFFFAFGGEKKILSSPSFLYLPSCLPCLPAFDG